MQFTTRAVLLGANRSRTTRCRFVCQDRVSLIWATGLARERMTGPATPATPAQVRRKSETS